MKTHDWHFFKAGSIRQVRIETSEDILNLRQLDCKLWTALAVPVSGIRFDRRTLEILDANREGRIRPPCIYAAIDYLTSRGVELADLFAPSEADRTALAETEEKLADLAKAEPTDEDKAAIAAWEGARAEAVNGISGNPDDAVAAVEGVRNALDAFFAVPDDMPLVTEEADKSVQLDKCLNPKYSSAIRKFADAFCAGGNAITRETWEKAKASIAPYVAWKAAKPVVAAAAKAQLEEKEKVLRLKLNLIPFLRNMVNQADLYDLRKNAIYQTGTLLLDARAFTLTFHVDDEAAHSALAGKSNCCLLYVKLTRSATKETALVCAAVTAGTTGDLYVGRNGIFIDVEGKDWNATVTKIVEAQVSLREAFWAPWRKMFSTLSDQLKKMLGDRQASAAGSVTKYATSATAQAPGAQAAPANSAALASSVAAMGVGIGMLGAAFAGLVGFFAGLPLWKSLLGVLLVVLAVSLPSVILTWFKLRHRDIGAILNAGGWAVNRPLRLPTRLARCFTREAKVPCICGKVMWLLFLLAITACSVVGAWIAFSM